MSLDGTIQGWIERRPPTARSHNEESDGGGSQVETRKSESSQ